MIPAVSVTNFGNFFVAQKDYFNHQISMVLCCRISSFLRLNHSNYLFLFVFLVSPGAYLFITMMMMNIIILNSSVLFLHSTHKAHFLDNMKSENSNIVWFFLFLRLSVLFHFFFCVYMRCYFGIEIKLWNSVNISRLY